MYMYMYIIFVDNRQYVKVHVQAEGISLDILKSCKRH